MIDNQMTVDQEPRLSYMTYQEIQAMYQRKPVKISDKPCITKGGTTNENR